MIRGRTKPITKLERKFWNEYPSLLIDDPEDELNQITELLRNTAIDYFRPGEQFKNVSEAFTKTLDATFWENSKDKPKLMILDDPELNIKLSWWKRYKLRKWYKRQD